MNMQEKESLPIADAGASSERLTDPEQSAGNESLSPIVDRVTAASVSPDQEAAAISTTPERSRQAIAKGADKRCVEHQRVRKSEQDVKNYHLGQWRQLSKQPSAGPYDDKKNLAQLKARCLEDLASANYD